MVYVRYITVYTFHEGDKEVVVLVLVVVVVVISNAPCLMH